jgi:hypothetical protein
MVKRADTYSDVPTLKRRARRFDEEVADELVQVRNAKVKNYRLKKFKLDMDVSANEEDDEDLKTLD